jgi:hypothetical protein
MVVIGTWSYEALGYNLSVGATNFASTTHPAVATTQAVAWTLRLSDYFLVRRVWWVNGATASTDSADVGVYDIDGQLLVSNGGTAISGANSVQSVTVTDTLLPPGRYLVAHSQNGVTATTVAAALAVPLARAAGVWQMTSAYPLPSTWTSGALASAYVPLFGISSSTVSP